MMTYGLPEPQLVDMIAGRINGTVQRLQDRLGESEALQDVLPEFSLEIARAVSAAIHANNLRCQEQAIRTRSEVPLTSEQYYDHLSQCIDGY